MSPLPAAGEWTLQPIGGITGAMVGAGGQIIYPAASNVPTRVSRQQEAAT